MEEEVRQSLVAEKNEMSIEWEVFGKKNKVHRLFCVSFEVNIKWWSVNNRWPVAVRKPTVHDAIQPLLPRHTHIHKRASEEANKNGIIIEYSYLV